MKSIQTVRESLSRFLTLLLQFLQVHFFVQTLKNKDCNAHDSEIDMVASILLQEMILNRFNLTLSRYFLAKIFI